MKKILRDIRKKMRNLVPFEVTGEHEISAKELGVSGLLSMILKAGLRYRRTMRYILGHGGIRNFRSFLCTKLFVPTGSGSGGFAYYFLGSFIRRFAQLYRHPICIEIETTTFCNKRCVLCERTYWNEPSVNMTFDEFKFVIDQFPNLQWFGLTGEGDPLLNPDITNMLRYAKSKGITVWLDESFDLLGEDVAKQFVDMNLDGVMWSMDAATKKVYESFKVGCNFERTLRHVHNLLRIKKERNSPIPEVAIRCIVSKLTVQEMPKLVGLVSSLGNREDFGDAPRIQYIGVLSFPEIQEHYLPEFPRELIEETIEESKKTVFPVVFAHTEPDKFPSVNKCLNWMQPYIFMKGYVVPCCSVMMSNKRDYLRKRAFGNVFQQPFKEIWNSRRYRKFRMIVNKPNAPVPRFCVGCRSYDTRDRIEKHGIDKEL